MSIVAGLILIASAVVVSVWLTRLLTISSFRDGSQTTNVDTIASLREVLDVLPDAALVVDREGQVIAASANASALGLVNGDRLATNELRALNKKVHRTRRTITTESTIGRQFKTQPGWEARLQISPLDDDLSLLIAQDISEERRLNEIRRDFVVNVSHELKTPVGAISLLAEAMQSAQGDPAKVQHFADRMQLEVRRLSEMISDLVELSQVQGETPLRHSEPVTISQIIAAAQDDTKVLAEKGRITVESADVSQVGRVFGDEAQLITAVRNLLTNAINYSPPDTKVGIGARRVDDTIEISITDQGPGIPDSELERIFERFYRVDPARSRETGGTGLGLAIVKHICANHGGECVVWSRLGHGSTFTLRLPAYLNGVGQIEEAVSA